jgi:hypothetical protein
MIQHEWKKRFELICEKKSNEYKLKSKQLELELLNANEEINQLRINKTEHDESLKKTFMRGICALNMEAMSVLLKDQKDLNIINEEKHRHKGSFYFHLNKRVLKFTDISIRNRGFRLNFTTHSSFIFYSARYKNY